MRGLGTGRGRLRTWRHKGESNEDYEDCRRCCWACAGERIELGGLYAEPDGDVPGGDNESWDADAGSSVDHGGLC